MRTIRCILFTFMLALGARAASLPLDRSIGEQPKYEGKACYLLLYFGEPSATRVWVAVDDKHLYIDRNGDGKLTGADEKISGTADKPMLYEVGSIAEKNGPTHTKFSLHRRGDKVLDLSVRIAGDREEIAMGELFDSPEKAVVLHFNGPLQLRVGIEDMSREFENKFVCMIGTPGVGADAFASYMHETIEKTAYVKAEFTWPGKDASAPPIKQSIDLKERCCGNLFYGQIRVPAEAGNGKAKVTVLFLELKSMRVAPGEANLLIVK